MASTDAKALADRIAALALDELAIVELLVNRIEQGRRTYGEWEVSDGRDYPAEAMCEVLDALHYAAAHLVLLQRRGR